VSADNYAAAFGWQWKKFRRTQLDSYTGSTIFRDRLTGAVGGSLEVLAGKSVLEAGCGAGAFTEILLESDARVFAVDLSVAVEANFDNCGTSPGYFVCQANILEAPVAPNSFDFVVCLGVIQHTPHPEETMARLAGYLKPGGVLVIDHYPTDYPYTLPRRLLRSVLLKLPQTTASKLALLISRSLLPLHRWIRKARGFWRLRPYLLKVSPLVDHYDDFPQLDEQTLGEWCVLNTHDTVTDRYKHMRSIAEIEACLREIGLIEIKAYRGGNGVEARGTMPESAQRPERSYQRDVAVNVAGANV
jgi:2-polyprenyl-3-methyl-5-hydroxy-6-metoxy-1,4-benzoquinol methylase